MAAQDAKWPKKRPNGQKRDPFSVDAKHEQAALSRRCQVFDRRN